MKKTAIALLLILFASLFAGCAQQTAGGNGASSAKEITLKVGATPVPHAEILEQVKPILAKEGINLEIVEFTDYVLPNKALAEGQIDANYFQHVPYLESFSKENKLDLTFTVKVHVEPMGIYSKKVKNLADLPNGAKIAIPNDVTNGGRALLLLQKLGVLKLKDGVGLEPTVQDITENPKNIVFEEVEAALIPTALSDPQIAAAVINGNYAIQNGLNPVKDAIALEDGDSPYANVIAVRKGDENKEAIVKLGQALQSPEIKKFIEEKYQGAVIPAF